MEAGPSSKYMTSSSFTIMNKPPKGWEFTSTPTVDVELVSLMPITNHITFTLGGNITMITSVLREHSGNIQGTFREHSGNIQGTFREHSGMNFQGTFRVYLNVHVKGRT
jgi:hypothetical protein